MTTKQIAWGIKTLAAVATSSTAMAAFAALKPPYNFVCSGLVTLVGTIVNWAKTHKTQPAIVGPQRLSQPQETPMEYALAVTLSVDGKPIEELSKNYAVPTDLANVLTIGAAFGIDLSKVEIDAQIVQVTATTPVATPGVVSQEPA